MSNSRPIGVFDSGIGGLTVVKSIMQKLPHENIVYFGDIARLPYGTKSVATIRKFAEQTVRFLLQHNVKAIVIACNTISAVAKDEVIKLAGDIPVLDVISSGSIASSHGNNIGIIATPATVNSNAYPNSIAKLNQKANLSQVACTLFVPLIEEGYINHKALDLIASEYLSTMNDNKIDTLVLGCTHYPIIKDTIRKIIGDKVNIIDPADKTSEDLVSTLTKLNLLNTSNDKPIYEFYVTEISSKFNTIGEMFLNTKLGTPKLVSLD